MTRMTPAEADACIQVLLFDFGGVMAEEGFRYGLYSIADRHGLDRHRFITSARDALYDTGFCLGRGSEADYWSLLRDQFALTPSDAQLTAALIDRFRVRPAMRSTVRHYRAAGLLCGLFSDQTEWLDRLDDRDGIYREFDRLYISCRLGRSKRDATAFDDVLADLGLAPDRVVFVDDDPAHVERARGKGIRGLVFTGEAACLTELAQLTGITAPA